MADAMKDLEALGWKDEGGGHYSRTFNGGVELVHLRIFEYDSLIYLGTNSDSIYMPTLDLALNAANALACVTPDNPKGRWVE